MIADFPNSDASWLGASGSTPLSRVLPAPAPRSSSKVRHAARTFCHLLVNHQEGAQRTKRRRTGKRPRRTASNSDWSASRLNFAVGRPPLSLFLLFSGPGRAGMAVRRAHPRASV